MKPGCKPAERVLSDGGAIIRFKFPSFNPVED